MGGATGAIRRPRVGIAAALRERRAEIEQAIQTRLYAIADPTEGGAPTYVAGLKAALHAALEYGLEGIKQSGEETPPIPIALLAQARMAARNDVGLDTVLRRYFAGYTLLSDFLVDEAKAGLLRDDELKRVLRDLAVLFDRLLGAVGEEHARESKLRPESTNERRSKRIERLLAGEAINTSDFAYDSDYIEVKAELYNYKIAPQTHEQNNLRKQREGASSTTTENVSATNIVYTEAGIFCSETGFSGNSTDGTLSWTTSLKAFSAKTLESRGISITGLAE